MKNIKVRTISSAVKKQFLITIAFLVIPLVFYLIVQPIIQYKRESKEFRENYLTNVETMLAERVNQTISHLTFHNNELSQSLSNQVVQDYVNFAHSVATDLYGTNSSSMNQSELQELICATLRNLRFNGHRGYFFVGDFNGVLILHTDRPSLEGRNLFDYQDSQGNYVFRNIISVALSDSGEGYTDYNWTMPGNNPEEDFGKKSFIKLFEPYNWYIGAGEYKDAVLELLQSDALGWITELSTDYQQNTFVCMYKMGGELLLHSNAHHPDTNHWDMQDANGNYIYRELQSIAVNGGGASTYITSRDSAGTPISEFTYAGLFEPWGWIITTGVFLEDVEVVLEAKYHLLKYTIIKRALILSLILLLAVLLIIKKTSSFSNRINKEFKVFLQYFIKAQSKESLKLIDKNLLYFKEFHHLADIANDMVLNTASINTLLEKKHQQLQLIIEGARIGWWDWDILTGKELYNNVLPELLGYSLDKIEPHISWWQKKIHPDDVNQLNIDLDLHFKGKTKLFTNKHRLKTKEGEWKWFFDHGKVVEWTEDGKPARMLGTLQDIDEQQKVLIKLLESEELYRLLADNTGDIVWIADLDMNITYISPAVKVILGHSVEQLLGQPLVSLVNEETLARLKRITDQRIALGPDVEPVLFNVNMIHKNGNAIPVEIKARILFDEAGKPYAVLGASRDVTERSTLEKELQQSQKMEAVGQLAGGIAHDFNNLLQAINGNAEMVLMKLESKSPAFAAVKEIAKAGTKASVLVQQILAFSRRQVLTIETINLNDVIKNFIPMLKGLITENVLLIFNPEKDLLLIDADTGQLEQVILNLSLNAKDAMIPKGGTITLTTRNTNLGAEFCKVAPQLQPGDYIEFTVKDTGTGMDELTRNSCFEPFFTTKDIDKGTGLGLATVYGLVKQHKGYITVDSVEGKGTTFTIYIPASIEKEIKQKKNKSKSVKGGRELILLADDDEGVLNIAKEFLVHSGYSVITASDGEEAIDLYNKYREKIDLFLLDVMMPKLGGYEVYTHIKNQNPKAKFLFASGYSKKAVHNNFILVDGLSLVQKPFKFAEFLKAIRDILDCR